MEQTNCNPHDSGDSNSEQDFDKIKHGTNQL